MPPMTETHIEALRALHKGPLDFDRGSFVRGKTRVSEAAAAAFVNRGLAKIVRAKDQPDRLVLKDGGRAALKRWDAGRQ